MKTLILLSIVMMVISMLVALVAISKDERTKSVIWLASLLLWTTSFGIYLERHLTNIKEKKVIVMEIKKNDDCLASFLTFPKTEGLEIKESDIIEQTNIGDTLIIKRNKLIKNVSLENRNL